jgi:hypothetical protein
MKKDSKYYQYVLNDLISNTDVITIYENEIIRLPFSTREGRRHGLIKSLGVFNECVWNRNIVDDFVYYMETTYGSKSEEIAYFYSDLINSIREKVFNTQNSSVYA